MTTKITPSVLENTAVVAATHGTAAAVPVIVVDPQGRITGVTNTSISIGTSQIGSGTLDDARLPAQADLTAANYYGDAAKTVAIVTDAKGRIKSAANVTIAIASSAVSGLATSATTDTTNATNISAGTLATARLADSGVVAKTYGTASSISQVVVDAKGRITGASNVSIQIATSQITSYPTFAASATTDTSNASNISTGTLPTARLADSGVVAGTNYGSASAIPVFNVDAKGRITSVTSTAISISSGSVSGLAGVATSGRYDALVASSGQPTIPTTLPASDVSAWAKAATKPSYAYSELSSLPTIPTNTNQLTNGAGFVTSSPSAIGGIGSIMQLFVAIYGGRGYNAGAKYFHGDTIAGSSLYQPTSFGVGASGGITYGYSRNDTPYTDTAPVAAYGYNNYPWNYLSIVYMTGTWRSISGTGQAYGSMVQVDDNGGEFRFVIYSPGSLWQRIS